MHHCSGSTWRPLDLQLQPNLQLLSTSSLVLMHLYPLGVQSREIEHASPPTPKPRRKGKPDKRILIPYSNLLIYDSRSGIVLVIYRTSWSGSAKVEISRKPRSLGLAFAARLMHNGKRRCRLKHLFMLAMRYPSTHPRPPHATALNEKATQKTRTHAHTGQKRQYTFTSSSWLIICVYIYTYTYT